MRFDLRARAAEFEHSGLEQSAGPTHGLVIVGADDFAAMQFPPRKYLLEPILQEKNLALVYGLRGVGKTIVGMGAALAVSTGTKFLRWQAPEARRVLYIDGELPQETLQKRLRDVAASIGTTPTLDLRLLTPDQQNGARIPNVANPEGQKIIEDCIAHEQAELVVFDNLSTLCRGGEENAAESWQVIQDWLIRLRSQRVSVLLLHHAGKSGEQRGTSKREDVLDVSLKIIRPKDYHPEQGARFEIHFEKARDPLGTAVAPFEAQLEGDTWTIKDLASARNDLIRRLGAGGLTQREIAREAGCSLGTVNAALSAREEK